MHVLDQLNDHIRTLAGGTPVLLADVHRHFLGTGCRGIGSLVLATVRSRPNARER
jgi:hypothetical protein